MPALMRKHTVSYSMTPRYDQLSFESDWHPMLTPFLSVYCLWVHRDVDAGTDVLNADEIFPDDYDNLQPPKQNGMLCSLTLSASS